MPKAGDLIRATPNTATETSASGVWSVDQAYDFVRQNSWPNASAIGQSLIFNDNDQQYLSRTPANIGTDRTVWTFACWVKRGNITGTVQTLLSAGATSDFYSWIRIDSDETLNIFNSSDGVTRCNLTTSAVFRDSSAYYHLLFNRDGSSGAKIYVNGIEQSVTGTNYSGTTIDFFADTVAGNIGRLQRTGTLHFDGYLAEINFIDGQALDPTNFGETDPTYGHWVPKKYSGSYGANGFYLDFSDNTALGTDKSGNDNTWTANNFSASATVVDTPTEYGTDRGQGGEVKGNYAVLNINDKHPNIQLLNGNLDVLITVDAGGAIGLRANFAVSQGKWYWEASPTFLAPARPLFYVGIDLSSRPVGTANAGIGSGSYSDGYAYISSGGDIRNNGVSTSYGEAYEVGDVVGVALDMDEGTLEFYKNGVSQGTAVTGLSGTYAPSIGLYTDAASNPMQISGTVNFGQRPFSYPAPEGFKCLTARNLEQPTIENPKDYFNTVLYTGNSSTQSITGVGFQPDFVWVKNRTSTLNHILSDAIRGANNALFSSTTDAEFNSALNLTSFDVDGFSVGSGNTVNGSGNSIVAWNWKAGGAGQTNTDGSITSTVSASPESGFSIVSYTLNGTTFTVGHGLNKEPEMILVKNRDTTNNWDVFHYVLGEGVRIKLNSSDTPDSSSQVWNNTAPTSTVFYGDSAWWTDPSTSNLIAYCFHSVEGYSKFGSYTGNGSSDGPFVYTGFRPAFVMIRQIANAGDWIIWDTKRDPYNVSKQLLYANLSNSEQDGISNRTPDVIIDILSNGFKARETNNDYNATETYIYMAFAENPFKFTNAR